MSLVIQNIAMKTRKADHSKKMLTMLVTHICVPYHCEDRGQNICVPPAPVNKSPKIECCIREAKTGAARFLYASRIGMKTTVCTISEWVGPRCSSPSKKSMSGIMETKKSKGMLILALKSLEVAFPVRYPRAMCPTANMVFSSICQWDPDI